MRFRALYFWLAVSLEVLVVLGFGGVKELVLRNSQTIVLTTVPVDPRDLFRGDYVALRYEFSSVRCNKPTGATVYVPLWRRGDVWVATSPRIGGGEQPMLWDSMSAADGLPRALQPDAILKGKVTVGAPQAYEAACQIRFGIESYFVPEGQGRELERARNGQLRVTIAVDGFGNAIVRNVSIAPS